MALRNLARNLLLQSASALHVNDLALKLRSGGPPGSRIVVVEMHETLSAGADRLRRQLAWVAKRFALLTPESFTKALETKTRTWPESQPAVLFTFDDGRECNYTVAAPILEEFGARGIFFVVPQFIGRQGNAAKDFYYSRIDIRNLTAANPLSDEIWEPMNPHQLADLARRGHWVGSHTFSHVSLRGLSAPELQSEIEQSSQQISVWTGHPVDAFAWPYSWDAMDRTSWEAVKRVYRFCFAPCPGTVKLATASPFLIWRKEIESYYPASEYQFMYSGLVDPFWAGKREKLRKILGQSKRNN